MNDALLQVNALHVSYAQHGRGRTLRLPALQDVSLELSRGETLGVVGESGSGKSTLARALLRLIAVDSGTIFFRGTDLLSLAGAPLQAMRRHLQMVFQDPFAALDPRQRIGEAIGEPLQQFQPDLSATARRAAVLHMLQRVGLGAEHLQRYPHEFSGGQAQRIGIARALILAPELIVCDEPLSALDVSIKSQIANLLKDLQRQMGLALLFIAHDLPAVRFACDRVLVLYLGRVMEIAPRAVIFEAARHPYTRALLQAVPIPDPARARAQRAAVVSGEIPSALTPPTGCVFRSRCAWAIERCARELPLLRSVGASRVACHRAEDMDPARTQQ